ncbi:hypothetical protein [Sphingopyxis sp.]|uniref:hypothetical protein n=1 Tax=Sphingopyxis sp. TaxID=1908224 RepID=UPI001E00E3AF|nr:hypothetical protein [Sphingopyxis sp.]MBW8294450.1 hypothetical protein [Sphingopyxis sp.]
MRMAIRTLLILSAAVFSATLRAEPTEVVVRVISQDAKFIGDSMGGAEIVLRDANTRRILARGITKGGTGDTKLIMQASGRSPLRSTSDAAAFVTRVDISKPTLVDLEVSGPKSKPGSTIRIVSQRWVMPGQPINIGDGWVVELPGLAISPTARLVELDKGDGVKSIAVTAKVELMCGCPITPGGLWDAKDYYVEVSAWQRGSSIAVAPLAFVEAPGSYAGQITAPMKGRYILYVTARNLKTGNSGVTQISSFAK